MNPQIGEVRSAREIGWKREKRGIWAACPSCGTGRWVPVGSPVRRCRPCGGREKTRRVLTPEEVREIRELALSGREAAEWYGVTRQTLWWARTGRTWQEVPGPLPASPEDEEAAAICRAYRAGMSIVAVARRFGVSPWRVRRTLARCCEPRRRPADWKGDHAALAAFRQVPASTLRRQNWEHDLSTRQIAGFYGVNPVTVQRRFHAEGIPIKPRTMPRLEFGRRAPSTERRAG